MGLCGYTVAVLVDKLSTISFLRTLQESLARLDSRVAIKRGSRISYRASLLGDRKKEL